MDFIDSKQLDFIKDVARDYRNIKLSDNEAKRAFRILTKEWGVSPASQDWFYKVREYFCC